MWKIPPPRLLPATIATLAALLVVKCGVLLEVAVLHGGRPDSAIVAGAHAASTERASAAGSGHAAKEHGAPEHGKPAAGNEAKPAGSPPLPDGPPPVSESERALL